MPNGILDNIEFENQINELGDDQLALIKFVARQQFAASQMLGIHDKKLNTLESGDRKISGIAGGISGTITAAIVGIINYFVNKG